MGKTWNVKKGCWVEDKTGQPVSQGNHNVWSTDKKKWVNIPVGSQLPKPQPKDKPR